MRGVRAQKNIPNKEQVVINVLGSWDKAEDAVIMKLSNASAVNHDAEKDASAATFIVGSTEVNIPLGSSVNVEAELTKLRKDLDYYTGFKTKIEAKLKNERFVNNAPAAVVEGERKKVADAQARIDSLTAAINAILNA